MSRGYGHAPGTNTSSDNLMPSSETYTTSQLNKYTTEELLKYHDRLVDDHDYDRFIASKELNLHTYRASTGEELLNRYQWSKLIRTILISREEN